MYRIEYLQTTHSDFKVIVDFYKIIVKNKSYAGKVTKKIKDKIKELKESPEMYAPCPFKSKNPIYPSPDEYIYRKLVVGNHVALYVVDHKLKKVVIVRIFDARSNYQNYL